MKATNDVVGKVSERAVPAEGASLEAEFRKWEEAEDAAWTAEDGPRLREARRNMNALRTVIELMRSREAPGGNGELSDCAGTKP